MDADEYEHEANSLVSPATNDHQLAHALCLGLQREDLVRPLHTPLQAA